VRDADLFEAMYAYSPYHRVIDGAEYPIDADDGRRVRPAGRRLSRQEDDGAAAGRDVVRRADPAPDRVGGHGAGQSLDQQVGIETDILAFTTARLGV
jgi:prolyl oligopeptidase